MTRAMRVSLAALLVTSVAPGCKQSGASGDDARQTNLLNFFPETLAEPVKVLSQTDDDVIATVSAPEMILSAVTLDGREFTQLRVPGFRSRSKEGVPEIPSVSVLVEVPVGKRLVFDVLERDAGETRRTNGDLAFLGRLPFHNGKTVFAKQNLAAYLATYGGEPVVVEDQSFAGADKLATIRFYPVRYDPARRQLVLTRFIKVHFHFVEGAGLVGERAPVGGPSKGLFKGMTLNNESRTHGNYAAGNKLDLVIAADVHKDALQRYFAFKKQRGRLVKDLYVTGKTKEQIKEMIRTEYKSATPPDTTMLVGNIDQIPAFGGEDDNTWTDYPYQTLDSGNLPDVALGRVPALDAGELNAWIDKAIARETQPRNVDEILLTAGEDVNLGCPTNVGVVGEKIKPAGPKLDIVQKFRSDGATTEEVIAGYNAAPNVIIYDGHGYQQGMVEVPLLIEDLAKLSNKQFPIILDIACLNANWEGGARARNFAESILLKAGAGAAGIMASGGSGYGHDYFQTIGSTMAAGRKAMATGDNKMNEIGQVILAAKVKHEDQDRSFWNYYGDPASSVWESDAGTAQPPLAAAEPAALAVFAALGTGETAAVLFASVNGAAKGLSYCLGDEATCRAATTIWLPMAKTAPAPVGLEVWATKAALALTDGAKVTVFAKMADDKEVFRAVTLHKRQ